VWEYVGPLQRHEGRGRRPIELSPLDGTEGESISELAESAGARPILDTSLKITNSSAAEMRPFGQLLLCQISRNSPATQK
jgi:hypothetical protein